MTDRSHGLPALPDFERVHRADEPRLDGPAPALFTPVENANITVDKEVITLNRAGSHPLNPILSGLGFRLQLGIGSTDSLRGLYVYQDRRNLGINLSAQAGVPAPGLRNYDFQVGTGQSVAGSPASGAKLNFIRWVTAFGAVEKQFYAMTKAADVVGINGQPCLHPTTLEAVEVVVNIVDATRPWLDVVIDFMVSWNDEFGKLHNAGNSNLDPGFLKSYGGAAFVSAFDTTPGTEGVGTACNPFTDSPIKDRHTLQVQNTAGLKQLTIRFRSKEGSVYKVDVPILIRVVAPVTTGCFAPAVEPCSEIYTKFNNAVPNGFMSLPSIVGITPVAAPNGTLAPQDLLFVQIRGATVGSAPKVRSVRWRTVANSQDLSGARADQFAGVEDFTPLIAPSSTPAPGAPYRPAEFYTIAYSVAQLKVDQIAYITVQVLDGSLPSNPILIVGPKARDVATFPVGEAGGGVVCAY